MRDIAQPVRGNHQRQNVRAAAVDMTIDVGRNRSRLRGGGIAMPKAQRIRLLLLLLACSPLLMGAGGGLDCPRGGMKFNDLNGNGVKDFGEPGLADWQICAFDNTGTLAGCQITDQLGNYV